MFNLSLNLIKEIYAAVLTAISGVVQSKEQVFAWMDDWAKGIKRLMPKPDILEVK